MYSFRIFCLYVFDMCLFDKNCTSAPHMCSIKTKADAKVNCIFTLQNVYTPEVWCYSAHTRFIDIVENDALTDVTECLRPISTEYLSVLLGFQSAELLHQKATVFIAIATVWTLTTFCIVS